MSKVAPAAGRAQSWGPLGVPQAEALEVQEEEEAVQAQQQQQGPACWQGAPP